jgi:hypothetical protein
VRHFDRGIDDEPVALRSQLVLQAPFRFQHLAQPIAICGEQFGPIGAVVARDVARRTCRRAPDERPVFQQQGGATGARGRIGVPHDGADARPVIPEVAHDPFGPHVINRKGMIFGKDGDRCCRRMHAHRAAPGRGRKVPREDLERGEGVGPERCDPRHVPGPRDEDDLQPMGDGLTAQACQYTGEVRCIISGHEDDACGDLGRHRGPEGKGYCNAA